MLSLALAVAFMGGCFGVLTNCMDAVLPPVFPPNDGQFEAPIGGYPPSAEELIGKWYLTQIFTSGFGIITPDFGSDVWTADYFIEFNEDGTFSELNYWNWLNIVDGTWALGEYRDLMLTLDRGANAGDLIFIGSRTLGLSADGQTLRMQYRRTQGGETWAYTHTFNKGSPTSSGGGNYM